MCYIIFISFLRGEIMGIFIKRPLCLFCFSFIAASLAACFCGGKYNLYLFLTLCAALSVCILLSFVIRKRRYGLIEASIALFMAVVAFVTSFIFIQCVDKKREAFCGNDITAEFVVLKTEYSSRYSSSYEGKIISLNGRRVSLPAYLKCEYEGEYAVGDTVFTLVDIVCLDKDNENDLIVLPRDITLSATPVVEKEQAIVYDSAPRFDVLCAKARRAVNERLSSCLDFDSSSLAAGLLTGDKSAIATEHVRDFRRAGLSHVLAVSGLHLAIIVGSVELLLKKLYVPKRIRCVLLSLTSFALLVLSGFSASACRSVVMLLCAYFVFLLSRDSDALTSLGVAGTLILLISPRTVGDVGFWLSFLATFGLVTWLELLKTSGIRKKGILASGIKKTWTVISTSLCAILSICFVSWYVFGEISVIGPLSNLAVTPLCEIYLVLSLVVLLVGGIPFISELLAVLLGGMCRAIYFLAGAFSKIGASVISLEYRFAGVIIVLATLLGLLLLIVKIRHKRIILTVPVAAIIAFTVCLVSFNYIYDGTRGTYISDEGRDAVVLSRGHSAIIIDASDGTYSPFYNAILSAKDSYATDVSTIVLTHYHAKHVSSLDGIFRSEMVHCAYLPAPTNENELLLANAIAKSAEENEVSLVIYDYMEQVRLDEETSIFVYEPAVRGGSEKKIVSFCVNIGGKLLTYADSTWDAAGDTEDISCVIEKSEVLILGSHGPKRPEEVPVIPTIYAPSTVIFSTSDVGGTKVCFYIDKR